MRVWRICARRHVETALSGRGAAEYPGRWNRRGSRVVYVASSRALALVELRVHLGAVLPRLELVMIPLDIPEDLPVEVVEPAGLPRGWWRHPAPEDLRDIGSAWRDEGRTALLQVPSAAVAGDVNYLINPAHRDFDRISAGDPERFPIDPRMFGQAGG